MGQPIGTWQLLGRRSACGTSGEQKGAGKPDSSAGGLVAGRVAWALAGRLAWSAGAAQALAYAGCWGDGPARCRRRGGRRRQPAEPPAWPEGKKQHSVDDTIEPPFHKVRVLSGRRSAFFSARPLAQEVTATSPPPRTRLLQGLRFHRH